MNNESYTIGLAGCASLKRPAPARELYVSQLFKKASAYAELTCDRWYVLSAKHGLVHPDEVIEPYDIRLGTNHRTSPPIHQWGARVKDQLDAELAGLENVTLIALAGEQYRVAVHNSPWPVDIPMKVLGIGQQLGWLTKHGPVNSATDRPKRSIMEPPPQPRPQTLPLEVPRFPAGSAIGAGASALGEVESAAQVLGLPKNGW